MLGDDPSGMVGHYCACQSKLPEHVNLRELIIRKHTLNSSSGRQERRTRTEQRAADQRPQTSGRSEWQSQACWEEAHRDGRPPETRAAGPRAATSGPWPSGPPPDEPHLCLSNFLTLNCNSHQKYCCVCSKTVNPNSCN